VSAACRDGAETGPSGLLAERALDACETAANVITNIVVKNA